MAQKYRWLKFTSEATHRPLMLREDTVLAADMGSPADNNQLPSTVIAVSGIINGWVRVKESLDDAIALIEGKPARKVRPRPVRRGPLRGS